MRSSARSAAPSVRVGKAIATPTVIWQPFASASVFHEFAGDVRSNYTSLNAQLNPGNVPFDVQPGNADIPRRHLRAVFRFGLAGQIVNTGWLGFVRVDYRNGEHIDGWTGNAGIRYRLDPGSLLPSCRPAAPRSPIPGVIGVTNWTGFYAGGFFGAAAGRTDIAFPGSPEGDQQAVGIRTDRRYPGSATTTSSPTTGSSGIEGDIGRRRRPWRPQRRHENVLNPGMTSAYFGLQDKTSLDGHGNGTRRLHDGPHPVGTCKAGAAFENGSVSATCFNPQGAALAPPSECLRFNQAGVAFANGTGFGTSSTRIGWSIGYGAEFDLGKNWSAKAEYDYIAFGSIPRWRRTAPR